MIVNENADNVKPRGSSGKGLGKASPSKGLKSPSVESDGGRRRSRRLSGASAEFEVTEFERSVEKQDKANRRMTVDPNDLLDLDLDDDEGEEAVEEKTIHTTRSEPNGRRSSVGGKNRRLSRRATIEPEDITALLNESTTSSKMEALTMASPAGTASRRSSRSSVGSKNTSTLGESLDDQTSDSIVTAPKNDRRATMDAMNMDDLLNDEEEDEGEGVAALPSNPKGRRHSVASFAHEGSTLEFRSGNGIRSHFNDDGNTQMTHLSSASIASMAPSETQTHGMVMPSVRRMTADVADMKSLSRDHESGVRDDADDHENMTEPVRRRQTMVTGRDLGLPSPSPLKPRAQSLAPGSLPAARFVDNTDNGGYVTENLTTRTEPAGTSASAALVASTYRPKSALKGGRRSSAAAEGHSVEFNVNVEDREKDGNTNVSMGSSRYVMFGSPKAAEFDKEGPTNALTPLAKADAKAMFSMNGTDGPETDADDEEDGPTGENSTILEQWDRLTNDGSGSEGSSDEDDEGLAEGDDHSGPLPSLGASRRSSIGLSSRRNSLGGGAGVSAGADLLHFDNTEELAAHSVIGRYSIGDLTDKTAELEPDLMAMLHNYDQRQEEEVEEMDEGAADEEEEEGAMNVDEPASNSVIIAPEEGEEEVDSDASTEEDENSVHNTSMSFSLMLNDSTAGEQGGSVLDRLKSLNSSSRRNTLDHASRTPTGSRLSLNKRRATIRSMSKSATTSSASKVLVVSEDKHKQEEEDDDPDMQVQEQEQEAAVERDTVASHVNEASSSFIESVPPILSSPASSIKSKASRSHGKRSGRSAPASPGTPLSQEKTAKRSRKKSPAKTASVPPSPVRGVKVTGVTLDAFIDSCGGVKGDGRGMDAIASVLEEVVERCPKRPAYTATMEAVLKHCSESCAVAKGAMQAMPSAETQWGECDMQMVGSLSADSLASLKEAAVAAAAQDEGKEQNRILEAIARQLEKKTREVRNRAKTIRRASVKLLTLKNKGDDTLNAEMLSAQLLADVQAEVHMARRHVEEMSSEMETVSDETSAALEEKKEQLVVFTREYSQRTDADQAVTERLRQLEAQLSEAENEVSDTRTKIGVMQSITHHTLKSFRPSAVSFDCVLSAGLKAVVDFHVKNTGPGGYFVSDVSPRVERTSIHSGSSGLDAGNDNVVSENMAAAVFHGMAFTDRDGPLSLAAIRDLAGQPFVTVHNTVQAFAGYLSSFRLVLSKLKLFADDGWNWTLQNRDVVLFTPDDRFKLTISMEILISGNIAALSTQCLRNREDRPMAELPIKAVLASLRNKYAGTLGSFPAAAFKRELDSILKYL